LAYRSPVYGDLRAAWNIVCRIGHAPSIHGYAPGADDVLGRAARGDSGVG
jgi:hypothetical protein